METIVLEIEADCQNQAQDVVEELGDLQLAIVGGGCAEVCPY